MQIISLGVLLLKFIGVAGVNGYGIYTDMNLLLKAQPYIREYNARSFQKVETALKWVQNKYKKLQGNEKGMYRIEQIQKLNWFYHRSY